MRTTLAIDDDVLEAARVLAEAQRRSMGEVISSLARQALKPADVSPDVRNGIRLLPRRDGATPVTMELVNKLREQLE